MTIGLIRSDISSWLQAHALGHEKARPRRELLAQLNGLGHSLDDRKMRRICEDMEHVGSCLRGYFWIRSAEDKRVAGSQLHGRALAELSREKRIRDAGKAKGQMELFGVEAES